MADEFIRPSSDTTLDGWTDDAGGTTTIYTKIDESTAADGDYVQSPTITAGQADLKVRLLQGSTQITEWTHSNIGTTFTDAAQTLSAPELAAISDFNDLNIELDDNAGSVYKFALGNPTGALATPVVVRYRYKKSVPATYTGPGDIISGAVGWWGLRAYAAANIGTAAIRVRRSDMSQQDILIAANGIIDVNDAFFNGSTPYEIVKLYDQSGNSRHSDALVTSDYPVLLLNDNGTLPAINNVSTLETSAANPDMSQPASVSVVAQRAASFGTPNQICYVGTKPFFIEFGVTANTVQIGTGAGSPSISGVTEGATHALGGVWNNTASKLSVDGSTTTGLNIADAASSGVGVFRFPGYVPSGIVKIWEGGFWPGDISSSFAALSTNQHTAWNF